VAKYMGRKRIELPLRILKWKTNWFESFHYLPFFYQYKEKIPLKIERLISKNLNLIRR